MSSIEILPSQEDPKQKILQEIKDLYVDDGFLISTIPSIHEDELFVIVPNSDGVDFNEEMLEDIMNGIGVNCGSVRGLAMEVVTKYGGPTGIKITLDN